VKTYINAGITINHAPAAAVAAGAVALIGVRIGVAVEDVAATTSGVFYCAGVFTIPKLSTDVVAQGALLYWDNTNKRLTTTASGNTLAGRAYAAAGNGATTVQALLNI
jgi:predicted RecA/RadA family phage recombinase